VCASPKDSRFVAKRKQAFWLRAHENLWYFSGCGWSCRFSVALSFFCHFVSRLPFCLLRDNLGIGFAAFASWSSPDAGPQRMEHGMSEPLFSPDVGDPLFAVDVGSGYVKAVRRTRTGVDRIRTPSLVAKVPPDALRDFGGQTRPSAMLYKDTLYLCGDDVRRVLPPSASENTLSLEWAGSDGWMVLLLRALWDLGVRGGRINLVTGVPQRAYKRHAKMIAERLVGKHTLQVGEHVMEVEIARLAPMVLPQAAGGMYHWMSRDPSLADVPCGGIDIGTYTTGYTKFDQGQPVMHESSGSEIGMSRVAHQLVFEVEEEFPGFRMPFDDAMRVLARADHAKFIRGEMRDLTPAVERAVRFVAPALVRDIQSVWVRGADDMRVGLFGGGAPLFYKELRKTFNLEPVGFRVEGDTLVPDPDTESQFAPVLGMLSFKAARLSALAASE
jgi:hypothetical protein